MTDARTIYDPFLGKDVVIVDRLTNRLRGNYACGPHLPNGRPEFGFRQFQAPPIQHEAAAVLDALARLLQQGWRLAEDGTYRKVAAISAQERET
jgi:hypothetical protein